MRSERTEVPPTQYHPAGDQGNADGHGFLDVVLTYVFLLIDLIVKMLELSGKRR